MCLIGEPKTPVMLSSSKYIVLGCKLITTMSTPPRAFLSSVSGAPAAVMRFCVTYEFPLQHVFPLRSTKTTPLETCTQDTHPLKSTIVGSPHRLVEFHLDRQT